MQAGRARGDSSGEWLGILVALAALVGLIGRPAVAASAAARASASVVMPVSATAVQLAASATVTGEGTLLDVVASVSSAQSCADKLCVMVEFN